MPIDELIRQLEVDPEPIQSSPEVKTPEVFNAWVRRCLELTSAHPRKALKHVDTAVVIAKTKCQLVMCLALKAAAFRNLGRLSTAGENLDLAFSFGRGCVACEAELHWRRGLLLASMEMPAEALSNADESIRAYRRMPDSGHEISGNGLAASHHARGNIRQYFGLPAGDESLIAGALEDFGEVLSLADPVDHHQIYGHGLLNLGVVLRKVGGFDNLKLANEHIREAWKYFNGRKHEASREKAHLSWQTATIRFELRKYPEGLKEVKDRPATLRGLLERSRDDFITVNMPAESVAVASDLSQALFPKRAEIIEVMDDTFGLIRNRWASFTPELRQAFPPVRKAMGAVRQAAGHDVTIVTSEEHHSRMRAAIERLRDTCAEAAQGQLLPCLLSWSQAT